LNLNGISVLAPGSFPQTEKLFNKFNWLVIFRFLLPSHSKIPLGIPFFGLSISQGGQNLLPFDFLGEADGDDFSLQGDGLAFFPV
jgi:hypothetical protein